MNIILPLPKKVFVMNFEPAVNNNQFSVKVLKKHSFNQARITQITTPHGTFETPSFMPVGTRAYVNCLSSYDLSNAGSQIILGGNTYHMLVSPGLEIIEKAGGMHPFMHWHRPMLTDSGGFQVFSLSKNKKICKIDEIGAKFKHPDSGKIIHLNPTTSIHAQKVIGADIIMAFDQCTQDGIDKHLVKKAMDRTHRWLLQSIEEHQKNPNSIYGNRQALFGIIQGSDIKEYREQSTEFIVNLNLDGIAIGGETIGFDMIKTLEILGWIMPYIPENKPRYTMGVGAHPTNLIEVVAQGIDMFDCVAPTRNARHGSLYCGQLVKQNNWIAFESEYKEGRINLNNAQFTYDYRPIMEKCPCYTCQNCTRAYLRYLLKNQGNIYHYYATLHNIQVMHDTCNALKACILEN